MAFVRVSGGTATEETAEVRVGNVIYYVRPNSDMFVADEHVAGVITAVAALGGAWAGATAARAQGEL